MGQSAERARITVHASDRKHRLFHRLLCDALLNRLQTQSGDLNNNTTRFWLSLPPAEAFNLLLNYLITELGSENVITAPEQGMIRVIKVAGSRSVQGAFVLRASDSLAVEGQTLVNMKRAKVSSLIHTPNIALMSLGRGVYCIGERSGGQWSDIGRSRNGSSRVTHEDLARALWGLGQ